MALSAVMVLIPSVGGPAVIRQQLLLHLLHFRSWMEGRVSRVWLSVVSWGTTAALESRESQCSGFPQKLISYLP